MGAIRTPDQRLRVFVSSTLGELADERAGVARAIGALRLTPVMFELGARPHPPKDLYRSYLEQSDIFVGVYWQRYGWVAPDMEISGLEDELVLSEGMPRLLYLKAPAPDREPRLAEMLDRMEAEGSASYRRFRTVRELSTLVRDDLAVLLSERFAAADASTASPAGPGSAPIVAAAPPPDTVRRTSTLPAETTSLVGRAQDVEAVATLVSRPEVRLVTLTGPGGIGKTRLAIAVAHQLDARYPEGAVFVPLASITDPALVLPTVAGALGAPLEGTRPVVEVVAEHIGDSPALLVLDNLEQVVGVAADLDQLLSRCPGLTILATSRTVLRIRAEHEHPVAPLTLPEAVDHAPVSVDQMEASSAAQLFVERAQAVRPDFTLTDADAAAVAQICRRLDGLPLAIELAAARIRLLDPGTLASRLAESLDALGTGPVDLPERQRTLRATIGWSASLLDPDQRALLATLSVFVDGWDLAAAAHVADQPDDLALDLLDQLVGHSLVVADVGPGAARFRLLESVRDFAAELLDADGSPERGDVERRHADHFRRLVEANDWAGAGFEEPGWGNILRGELGNLRAALRWFADHDIAPLPHLFRVLWVYWQMYDLVAEGRALVGELLPRVDELDETAQVELWIVSAVTAVEMGDDAQAVAAVRALEHLPVPDDPFLAAAAELIRSWILPLTGDLNDALVCARSALASFRRQHEPFLLGVSLLEVGMLEGVVGDRALARQHFDELGGPAADDRFAWFQASRNVQLATLAAAEDERAEARSLLTEAVLADRPDVYSTHTLGYALVATARVALSGGDGRRAATALGTADGLRRRAHLRAWPSQRLGEDVLRAEVEQALGTDEFASLYADGTNRSRREAIALLRSLLDS